MNCEQFADRLDNYSCLAADELQELEAHAEICEACANELSFMRSILAAARSLPPIEPPSDFLDKVNSRLDEELASEKPIDRFIRRSRPYVSRYGAIAACVAVAAVVSANAGTMLTRMQDDGSGIISEQKTTEERADAGTVQSAEPEALPEIGDIASSQPTGAAEAPAVTVQPISAAPTLLPQPTQAAAKAIAKTDAPAASRAPAAQPQSRSSAPASSVPAATPQPSAAENTGTPSSAPVQSEPETVPDVRARFDAQPAETATEQPQTAEKAEPEYNIAANDINSANEYAAAPEAETADEDIEPVSDISEYMLAYLDSEHASTYASLSSTVSVKAKDINRVQELVDVFVNGVYGNYYMITAQDMNSLLGQFDREGIWYSANIMESGDKISFKLITMQMD